MDYEEYLKQREEFMRKRPELERKQLAELNQTPLSQECKRILKDPWDGSLYLLQALLQSVEDNWPTDLYKHHWTVRSRWTSTRDILEEMGWRYLPKKAYEFLTTSEELGEEMSDAVLLAEMQKETEREDKLRTLLDWAMDNLEENGFNLSGVEPTRD